jgi:hypothetical protein
MQEVKFFIPWCRKNTKSAAPVFTGRQGRNIGSATALWALPDH